MIERGTLTERGYTSTAAHANLAVHNGRTNSLLWNRSAVQCHPAAATSSDQDQNHAHDEHRH